MHLKGAIFTFAFHSFLAGNTLFGARPLRPAIVTMMFLPPVLATCLAGGLTNRWSQPLTGPKVRKWTTSTPGWSGRRALVSRGSALSSLDPCATLFFPQQSFFSSAVQATGSSGAWHISISLPRALEIASFNELEQIPFGVKLVVNATSEVPSLPSARSK